MKLCWICGKQIVESGVGSRLPPFHTEVKLIIVNRPYASNFRSKPVYVCEKCTKEKIGISRTGKNLNP